MHLKHALVEQRSLWQFEGKQEHNHTCGWPQEETGYGEQNREPFKGDFKRDMHCEQICRAAEFQLRCSSSCMKTALMNSIHVPVCKAWLTTLYTIIFIQKSDVPQVLSGIGEKLVPVSRQA